MRGIKTLQEKRKAIEKTRIEEILLERFLFEDYPNIRGVQIQRGKTCPERSLHSSTAGSLIFVGSKAPTNTPISTRSEPTKKLAVISSPASEEATITATRGLSTKP